MTRASSNAAIYSENDEIITDWIESITLEVTSQARLQDVTERQLRDSYFHERLEDLIVGCLDLLEYSPTLDMAAWLKRRPRRLALAEPSTAARTNEEGGLSERALRRAMELANEADLRLSAPKQRAEWTTTDETIAKAPVSKTNRLLPGTMLKRDYKGRTLRGIVLTDGFEFEGERYRSLTAVAKSATGKHWNGYHFFGLREKRGGE